MGCSENRKPETICSQKSAKQISRFPARKNSSIQLKNSDGEGTRSDGKSRTAKWSSTSVHRECRLHGRTSNGHATRAGNLHELAATSWARSSGSGARRGEPSAETCKCARCQLVSESVRRTCLPAPCGRRGARFCARGPPGQILARFRLGSCVRLERDGEGVPIFPAGYVTDLVARRHVWEKLILMDGVTRAVEQGKLCNPRSCWRIQGAWRFPPSSSL